MLRGNGRNGRPACRTLTLPGGPALTARVNPVGDYHRTFEMPDGWRTTIVRFDGVESQASVWVNRAYGWAWPVVRASPTSLTSPTARLGREYDHARPPVQPRSGPEDQTRLPGIFPIRQPAPPRLGSIEDLLDRHHHEAGAGYVTVEARVLGPRGLPSLLQSTASARVQPTLRERATTGLPPPDRPRWGDVRPWNPEDPASTRRA